MYNNFYSKPIKTLIMTRTFSFFNLLLVLFITSSNIVNGQTAIFNYTGTVQTYTVPAGVTCVTVDAQGASGGAVGPVTGGITATTPGNGGRVEATLTVVPGAVLDIKVGGVGADGTGAVALGGYNGGGNASPWSTVSPTWTGGAGGGASDIRVAPYGLVNRQIVAAGGGGAGFNGTPCTGDQPGGDGGGISGADAVTCVATILGLGYTTVIPAGGGTPVGGGVGGVVCCGIPPYTTGGAGTSGVGGNNNPDGGIGGGGGGGYFGGGGGCWTGGGGGSSYANPVTTSGVIHTPGFHIGNGVVTITAPALPAAGTISGPTFYCFGVTLSGTYTNPTAGAGVITWSSSNTSVITIGSTTGVATPVATGVANIICTVNGGCSFSTTSLSVTVNSLPAAVTGPLSLCVTSTATYTDASGGGTWSLNNPAIATISGTGVVTPIAAGPNIVSYTVGGCNATPLPITINDTALQITGANSTCQDIPTDLVDATSGGVWSSSNTSIATVSASGVFGIVTPVGSGPVTIFYTMLGCPSRTHALTINPLPAPITGPTAICVGLGTVLSDATPGGSWTSSNSLATVSPSGVVTCSVVGITDTIYYTLILTGCRTSAVVNTGTSPFAIHGDSAICQGATTTLSDSTPGGVWSSTSLATAQVIDSSGFVTGISAGLVHISYTMPNGCFSTIPFTVLPPLPASVTVTGPANPVCSGFLDSFIAHPVNGGTPTYYWKKFASIPLPAPGSGDTLKYHPVHGDVVMCYMVTSHICSVKDTVVDTFAINVYPDSVSPVVTITTEHSDSAYYIGEIITFNANVTWGGTLPVYHWYVNGVLQPGATGSSFAWAVYHNDTVYCVVSGNPPCQAPIASGVSNHIAIRAGYLDVNQLHATGSLNLFPNPNTGNFTLSGTVDCNSCKAVNYEVINVLGQVVLSGVAIPVNGAISEQISAGSLISGSYMLRVNTETGNQIFHFVISR